MLIPVTMDSPTRSLAAILISLKIMLDAMSDKVGLPVATYSSCASQNMRLEVTANFQPIMGTLRGPEAPKYVATKAIMGTYQKHTTSNHLRRKCTHFIVIAYQSICHMMLSKTQSPQHH